jgi:hypothetical protein
MKIVIIAFAMIMMLAGGVVSIMKWLKIGPFAEQGAAEAVVVKPKLPPRFLEMPPLVVPILQGEGPAATIQLDFTLEAEGDANARRIEKLMPKIGDAFFRELFGFIPRLLKQEGRLNLSILKKRLMIVADKVGGPGTIAAVLVQAVAENAPPGAGDDGGPARPAFLPPVPSAAAGGAAAPAVSAASPPAAAGGRPAPAGR